MTRDIRNYQLLVICNARSNVTSLNLSLKKGQNTTKKSQSCVKIVKLPIQKLLVFIFRSTRIIRSISDELELSCENKY